MAARISRSELKDKIDRGDVFVLVDTLPQSAYDKYHLPGAISIPSDDITEAAPRLVPDRAVAIVVYCMNGPCRRSRLAAERLARLGYTNVRDYHEGREDWAAGGLPVERESLPSRHESRPCG